MKPEENLFRSAVMGGFNREDVTAYLEKMSAAHREELSDLQNRLEAMESARIAAETAAADLEKVRDRQAERITELTQALSDAEAARDAADSRSADLQRQLDELQRQLEAESVREKEREEENSSLKAQVTVLAEVRRALSQKSEALGRAEEELKVLREERQQMLEDAEAYRAVKDRVAGIELEAHQRAQEAEDEAQRRAEEIALDMERQLGKMARDYQRLYGVMDEALNQTRQELKKMGECVDGIASRFYYVESTLSAFLCRNVPLEREQLPQPGEESKE